MNLELKQNPFTFNLLWNRNVKPQSTFEFAFYFAGLVDADGYFTKTGGLSISFHAHDLSVARTLRARLGGYIYKYKRQKAYSFNIENLHGRKQIYNMLHGKLQHGQKIKHLNTRLAARLVLPGFEKQSLPLNTHYFAGFLQGDGSFQIKIRQPHARFKKRQVEMHINFELKQQYLCLTLKDVFGVYFRVSRNTYTYSSVNLSCAKKWANYLKTFHVQGSSYRLGLIWSYALSLVLEKAHWSPSGLDEIQKCKTYMSALKQSTCLKV